MQRNTLPGQYTGFGEPVYPSYQKRSLYVPGFDDTKLAVDIIRPVNEDGTLAPGPFPAILLISRGGRFGDITDASGPDIIHHCVPYGYVGVDVYKRQGLCLWTKDILWKKIILRISSNIRRMSG